MNRCVMLGKVVLLGQKYGFSAQRPGERRTSTSDVKPEHSQQDKQSKNIGETKTKAKDVVFENSCYSADIG